MAIELKYKSIFFYNWENSHDLVLSGKMHRQKNNSLNTSS